MHDDAPETFANVPRAQSVHDDDPFMLLNFPGPHSVQFCPALKKPVLHKQLEEFALPTTDVEFGVQLSHSADVVDALIVEYVPTPQPMQALEPFVFLYVPGRQGLHALFSAKYPELQTHCEMFLLACCEVVEFWGHAVHVVDPAADEYWPCPHMKHALAPSSHSKVPGSHSVQRLAAIELANEPAEQLRHWTGPDTFLNEPRSQGKQGAPLAPV